MTIEEIQAALTADPQLVIGLMPTLAESETGKTLINNKAKVISESTIGAKISEVYKKMDDDMFEVLGVRPGTAEDGTKEKTYAKAKEIYAELKELKSKGDFSKDDKVRELEGKLSEALKGDAGANRVQGIFDQAKQDWTQKEADYRSQIEELGNSGLTFQKQTEINNAISQIKFNPDTPKSVVDMVIESVTRDLESNSRKEGDKFLYLNKQGETMLNAQYEPKTTLEVIQGMQAIQDISLKGNEKKGGGANTHIKGGVQEVKVEGKDETVMKLNLVKGSFSTKSGFQEVANKLLLDKGITKRDPNFNRMKDAAYIELGVKDLPSS